MKALSTMRAVAVLLVLGSTACASGSGNTIDSVLGAIGSAAGGGQAQQGQAQGTVTGVNQTQIGLQLSGGQQVALDYDQNTTVVYQNRSYAVANLERGDVITVTVQSNGNNGYYVSAVQVDQSVQGGNTANNGSAYPNGSGTSVQSFQGTVRQVDTRNDVLTLDTGNGYAYTVTLVANPGKAERQRFRALRAGDAVRFYGVTTGNGRIELRQFY